MSAAWEVGMNPEQVEAIRHTEGPCVLIAVAGCGKTKTLVNRIARLIGEGHASGEEVLAVTFARKAADEMEERLKHLRVLDCRVATWHSLCLQVLREDCTEWSAWSVDEKDTAKHVMKDVLGYKGMKWSGADLTQVRRYVGTCKANLAPPTSVPAMALARSMFGGHAGMAVEAYGRFQLAVEERALLTFDDFLVFAHQHLSSDEQVRRRWADRWRFVMQDEAQDANLAQVAVGRLLAVDHRNYMVVGDPGQAIYGFRGSSPDHLMAFEGEWGARVIRMHRNYRSGRAVVDAANSVIRPSAYRLPVDMVAERATAASVRVLSCANLDAEAAEFASWCARVSAEGEPLSSICCLFRTNAQSRAMEEALLGARIPYVVVGGTSFYERKEVKDLLGYLRVGADTGDLDAVRRSINAPFRFLGSAFVSRIVDFVDGAADVCWESVVDEVSRQAGVQARQRASAMQWVQLVKGIEVAVKAGTPPAEVLDSLVSRTGYIAWLEKEEGQESIESSQAANVRELVRVATRFPSVQELLRYVDETTSAAKRQRRDGQAGGERVLLMSIHRSKGLEWPRVFVGGFNEMILPHAKGDPEEERRLAYVAVTRARDELVVSYVLELAARAGIKKAQPSRFLADMGLGVEKRTGN